MHVQVTITLAVEADNIEGASKRLTAVREALAASAVTVTDWREKVANKKRAVAAS